MIQKGFKHISSKLKYFLLSLLSFIILSTSSCSKDGNTSSNSSPKGYISGIVYDSDGNILAGASIVLKQAGQNDKTVITKDNGAYTFEELPPGIVSLSCSLEFYNSVSISANITAWKQTSSNIIMSGNKSITTAIPDAKFEEALIYLGYDSAPVDGSVPNYKIRKIEKLFLSSLDISDLTGIENFISLKVLDCSYNKITSLDISKLTTLTNLSCGGNLLSYLDLSKNANLSFIDCNNNKLTAISTTRNPNLTHLNCSVNKISTLDLSANLLLTELSCNSNVLNYINISKNTSLVLCDAGKNSLTSLTVITNTLLEKLDCSFNNIKTLNASNNPKLTSLQCSRNGELTTLNIKNGSNTNLKIGDFTNNSDSLKIIVDDVSYSNLKWDLWKDSVATYVNSL